MLAGGRRFSVAGRRKTKELLKEIGAMREEEVLTEENDGSNGKRKCNANMDGGKGKVVF